MTDLPITVIVFSYNRPKMLQEALDSIYPRTVQVILCDDASDFDPAPIIRDADFQRSDLLLGSKVPVQERLLAPGRLGALANAALERAESSFIAYLCDDDLFHHDWLTNAVSFMMANPDEHLARGDWYSWYPEKDPARLGTENAITDGRQLTTGNFVHLRDCFEKEGVRWPLHTVTSHDDQFLWNMKNVGSHKVLGAPNVGCVAGWRRQHATNLIHFSSGHSYRAAARDLFERGLLE